MKYAFTNVSCSYWDWSAIVAKYAANGWEHVQSLRRTTSDDIDILFRMEVKA